jgi:hypothetical protein
MCLNVSVRQLLETIEKMCYQNGLVVELNREIIKYFKIQIHQNNFQYKYVQYIQEEVLALGAPTSSIFFGDILTIP